MLIQHLRTQGIYSVGDTQCSLVIDGKHYVVTPYIPVPNEESVLYLREPDNFNGFVPVNDGSDIQVLPADQYKVIKFKLGGQWRVVSASAIQ